MSGFDWFSVFFVAGCMVVWLWTYKYSKVFKGVAKKQRSRRTKEPTTTDKTDKIKYEDVNDLIFLPLTSLSI